MSSRYQNRVTVQLSPELHHAVTILSKAGGISRASYLRQTLELAEPSIVRLAQLLEMIENVQDQDRDLLAHRFSLIEDDLEKLISQFVPDVGVASNTDSEKGQVAGVPPRRPLEGESAERPGQPPYTNRGVPNTPQGTPE